MKKYDDIVVGSGASGLSLALLLGMNGHKVLVLEKSPYIGGGLFRFYRQGIPFDTGFHFTGGLNNGGLLNNMLKVLEINDDIHPDFLSGKHNQFIVEDGGCAYNLPPGIQDLSDKIKEYFPGEKKAVTKYFDMVQDVCSNTVTMDLRTISLTADSLDEDYVSLDNVLRRLTDNASLRALLSGYAMCHGVRPTEISFANHSRICFNLYESIARIKDGGDAFIRSFRERFKTVDVDILCDRYITECADVENARVGRFVLNSGEEVSCDNCILTIHPKEILKILPREHLTKAFINRISAFESSAGFFSIFGTAGTVDMAGESEPGICCLFPVPDVDKLLDPHYKGKPAMAILKHYEMVKGKLLRVITAFEPSFSGQVKDWADFKLGKRPAEYQEYKKQRTELIRNRILELYPEYRDSFQILDAASSLTFRDYLHSPDGSAYGIKQKIGQYNLFGKLPLRNMYAAGQSSVLPGFLGAMTSSFIIARSIIGKDQYNNFIRQRL